MSDHDKECERMLMPADYNRAGLCLCTERRLRRELAEAQAKIDRLMLEYCPEEMTEEQMQRWADNQRLLTEEEQAAIEAAIESKP